MQGCFALSPYNVKANRAGGSRQPRSEPAFRAVRLSGLLDMAELLKWFMDMRTCPFNLLGNNRV